MDSQNTPENLTGLGIFEQENQADKDWQDIELHLGSIDNLIGITINQTRNLLDFTDAADIDDIRQEAMFGLFNAWQDKKNSTGSGYKNYLKNLQSGNPDIDLEKPSVFAGYAKTRMRWDVIKNIRTLMKGNNQGQPPINETSLNSGDEEYDLFERISLISEQTNPGIDEITRSEFEEKFGIINNKVEAQQMRETLYKTVYKVIEDNQMRSSGPGSYTKKTESAQNSRRVAFQALYLAPAMGEEITLKKAADLNGLNYEAVKKEAQRMPIYLFAYKDQVIEEMQKAFE